MLQYRRYRREEGAWRVSGNCGARGRPSRHSGPGLATGRGGMVDFRKLWGEGQTFEAFVAACKAEHCSLWQAIYKLARIPGGALAAGPPGAGLKLLVIAEDWCGDASNTVPVLARLADLAPGLELRVIQ